MQISRYSNWIIKALFWAVVLGGCVVTIIATGIFCIYAMLMEMLVKIFKKGNSDARK
jgi:hypothetical protein